MNELRPYLRLLAAYRGRILLGSALMLATVAAGVGLLALSGWFITATGVVALLLAAGTQARLEVFLPGAGIRFFALARTVARYFERVQNHDVVLRLLADLRTHVFARLIPLDPATLARFRGALVLNRLTADIDALDSLYLRCLAPPLVGLLAILGVTLLLGLFAPLAGLLTGGLLLVLVVGITVTVASPGAALGERIAQHSERARIHIVDLVRGLAELRAFGVTDRQRAAIDDETGKQTSTQARSARLAAGGEALAGLAVHYGVALSLLLAVWFHAEGHVSGPVAALMPLAVLALAEGLAPVPGGLLQLGRSRAAARRLNEQVDVEPAIKEPAVPTSPRSGTDLRIERVTVRYTAAADAALQDFSLVIAPGERVAVIGRSGCGKSTLADLCARLVEPERGQVRLGGVDIAHLRLGDLHGRIGYLTQRSEIFADTIAANLRLARPDATEAALWDALERVCLADFVDSLGDGLATWVGENGMRLSGGQARRLALARVVLRDAPIALLDEPLAGLDRETAREMNARLEPWLAARTTLLLGHERAALPSADRVIALEP